MDIVNSKDEVFNDFKNVLEKIDFSAYNPNDADFSNALQLGLMWWLLHKVEKYDHTGESGEEHGIDEISEELSGAKKYLQDFIDTNDVSFKEMAKDELRHAGVLIRKANAKLPTGDEKVKLKSYEVEMQEIMKQIES